MMCADKSIRQCHPIIACIIVNYEKQVVITSIESSI